MAPLYNRVRVRTPTTGTGTLSIGQPVDGWLDFGEALVADGATVSYLLEEGNNVEWGRGVYDLTAGTLTRTVTRSKTADGVVGTDPLSLGGGAELSITALAADFNEVDGDFVPDTDDGGSIGTLSLKWSDLFLASGAVINFDEGDITLTHSASGLDFAGGAFRFPNTGLQAYDTDGSHVLTFAPGSNLTADRTLNFTTGDADRTVTLQGNPTLDDWFDQSVKQAVSPTFAGATVNGNITITGTVDGRDVSNDGAAQDAHIADTDNPHSVTADQLSLGTGDSPQFTAVNIGHASDTTLARASAGDLNVEGNIIYRAGGTDVPVADGGTGASDASGARTNLDVYSTGEADAAFEAADPDILKADVPDVLEVGYATTVHNAGTQSSGTYTPDEANGNFQRAVNGGAHTLAPPTNDCNIVIQYTNNASAGAITTSGFTQVTGDSFSTDDGDDFLAYITKINGFSHLNVVALQ